MNAFQVCVWPPPYGNEAHSKTSEQDEIWTAKPCHSGKLASLECHLAFVRTAPLFERLLAIEAVQTVEMLGVFKQKYLTLVILLVIAAPPIFAQSAYDTRLGTVEVGGGFGVFALPERIGSHPSLYARAGVALHRTVVVFGEYGYTPIGERTGSLFDRTAHSSANISDYGAGLQLQIPTGTRFLPYGVAGIGALHGRASESGFGYNYAVSDATLTYNFGAGLKVFLSRRIGVDMNLRGYKPNNDPLAGRGTLGVFFQWRK